MKTFTLNAINKGLHALAGLKNKTLMKDLDAQLTEVFANDSFSPRKADELLSNIADIIEYNPFNIKQNYTYFELNLSLIEKVIDIQIELTRRLNADANKHFQIGEYFCCANAGGISKSLQFMYDLDCYRLAQIQHTEADIIDIPLKDHARLKALLDKIQEADCLLGYIAHEPSTASELPLTYLTANVILQPYVMAHFDEACEGMNYADFKNDTINALIMALLIYNHKKSINDYIVDADFAQELMNKKINQFISEICIPLNERTDRFLHPEKYSTTTVDAIKNVDQRSFEYISAFTTGQPWPHQLKKQKVNGYFYHLMEVELAKRIKTHPDIYAQMQYIDAIREITHLGYNNQRNTPSPLFAAYEELMDNKPKQPTKHRRAHEQSL